MFRPPWNSPRTPEEKQVVALYSNGGDVGYAIMSGPRVPADRVKILRDAFQAMLTDKAFLDDVGRLGAEFDPLPGAELQKVIAADDESHAGGARAGAEGADRVGGRRTQRREGNPPQRSLGLMLRFLNSSRMSSKSVT